MGRNFRSEASAIRHSPSLRCQLGSTPADYPFPLPTRRPSGGGGFSRQRRVHASTVRRCTDMSLQTKGQLGRQEGPAATRSCRPQMEITRARAQDIDAILDLWGELAAFHADLDPAFTPAAGWRAAYAGYLATLLGRPDARVLVAHQEGRIVGYGVARITLPPPGLRPSGVAAGGDRDDGGANGGDQQRGSDSPLGEPGLSPLHAALQAGTSRTGQKVSAPDLPAVPEG